MGGRVAAQLALVAGRRERLAVAGEDARRSGRRRGLGAARACSIASPIRRSSVDVKSPPCIVSGVCGTNNFAGAQVLAEVLA